MKDPISNLLESMQEALATRPKVGGFPHLAEKLRAAGVVRNLWTLPSCQSIYITTRGNVVMTGPTLISGATNIPPFDQARLIKSLRADQAGETTFEEFLAGAWESGCVSYEVDFNARTVAYHGVAGEVYLEEYPAVSL